MEAEAVMIIFLHVAFAEWPDSDVIGTISTWGRDFIFLQNWSAIVFPPTYFQIVCQWEVIDEYAAEVFMLMSVNDFCGG